MPRVCAHETRKSGMQQTKDRPERRWRAFHALPESVPGKGRSKRGEEERAEEGAGEGLRGGEGDGDG